MQQKLQIVFIDSSTLGQQMVKGLEKLKVQFGDLWELKIYSTRKIEEGKVILEDFCRDVQMAAIVLIDIRGESPILGMLKNCLAGGINTVIPILGGSKELMALARLGNFEVNQLFALPEAQEDLSHLYVVEQLIPLVKKVGQKLSQGAFFQVINWVKCIKYWRNSGQENMKNLLLMVSQEYGGLVGLPKAIEPIELPAAAIFHPRLNKIYEDLGEYLIDYGYDSNKSTIGILYYSGMHHDNALVPTKALIAALEPKVNVIPIISDGISNLSAVEKFAFQDEKCILDTMINLTWFKLNGGPRGGSEEETHSLLQKINIPCLHPIPMYSREKKKWLEEPRGISPIEFIANVIMPELDGMVEPIPICAVTSDSDNQWGFQQIEALPDRVERIAQRAIEWAQLKRTANHDKKVAIILYNYPPGEDNMGNAAYLDVFFSIKTIFQNMKEQGYNVADWPDDLAEAFLEKRMVNSPKWSSVVQDKENFVRVKTNDYLHWLAERPDFLERIEVYWGKAPGDIMALPEEILLPGLQLGNVFLGLQPARGIHDQPDKAYHDKDLAPHHQYLAFYRWLEEGFKADAVIHVGTHGTLEFTPGKEMAMSDYCFPDFLLGNVPHLYIYQVGNPSEAMLAKRRSMATLVSYNTPAVTSAGLYGNLLELEMLLAEREEALLLEPARVKLIEKEIWEKVKENHWQDLNTLEEVEGQLVRFKRAAIPRGLHRFGQTYTQQEKIDFLTFILRYDRGDLKSLNRILAEADGWNWDYLLHNPNAQTEKIDQTAASLLAKFIDNLSGMAIETNLPRTSKEELEKSLQFAQLLLEKLEKDQEIPALMNGLASGYIQPNLAGDPIRTPEVLPTGTNLYQFDPLQVPTDSAYIRGAQIADNTLEQYYEIHRHYPQSTGVILWGFETAKTRGETVGQILHYLGIRLQRKPGDWSPRLEVIPLDEIARPRIDVVVTICGFFRDMFPNLVHLLDRAFRLVAELKEEEKENFIRAHSLQVAEEIEIKLGDKNLAWKMSQARIFGPKSGTYGTRLTSIIETANWEEESQLGKAYLEDMQHIYGEELQGVPAQDIYQKQLSRVEVISQVQDTYQYEVTDLDHYYEYFGGLAKSVEVASGGKKPELLVSNTSSEIIITEDIGKAIRRGLQTRLLNPEWIDGMLEHKYHGAQKIADRVEYQLGLAATTNKVESWMWSSISETYLFNQEMLERMKENNPFAVMEMMKRLLEAQRRGYWEATPEEMEKLKEIYLQLEGEIEERVG